jgi:hypothetical protein
MLGHRRGKRKKKSVSVHLYMHTPKTGSIDVNKLHRQVTMWYNNAMLAREESKWVQENIAAYCSDHCLDNECEECPLRGLGTGTAVIVRGL